MWFSVDFYTFFFFKWFNWNKMKIFQSNWTPMQCNAIQCNLYTVRVAKRWNALFGTMGKKHSKRIIVEANIFCLFLVWWCCKVSEEKGWDCFWFARCVNASCSGVKVRTLLSLSLANTLFPFHLCLLNNLDMLVVFFTSFV